MYNEAIKIYILSLSKYKFLSLHRMADEKQIPGNINTKSVAKVPKNSIAIVMFGTYIAITTVLKTQINTIRTLLNIT